MKNLFILLLGAFMFLAVAETQAETIRVYSTGDVALSGADVSFDLTELSFPSNTTGLIVEAIYKKMDGTAEDGEAVKLYNSVTSESLPLNPNPFLIDSLAYEDGDGETYIEFAKINFYRSALRILIDRPEGASDTYTVKVNLWAIDPDK
jgi:hypothetical protein